MMTTFDPKKHPREQTGPNPGHFAAKGYSEPDVSVGAPDARQEAFTERMERAQRLHEQKEAARDLMLDLQLDRQRLALKNLGEGLKADYPTARYLNLTRDYESSDGYWLESVTDGDGNVLVSAGDVNDNGHSFAEVPLIDGGPTVEDEVSALSRQSTRWMKGVTDDDGEAASFGQGDEVAIDLDKAAALELGSERAPVDAVVAGEENRKLVREALDDAGSHLDDILEEQAEDYDESDLEDIRDRIAAMARFADPETDG